MSFSSKSIMRALSDKDITAGRLMNVRRTSRAIGEESRLI